MPDRSDQRRERHEDQVAPGQLGRLLGELLHLLPHDRIRGIAGRRLLGPGGGAREEGLGALQGDRAFADAPDLLELGQQDARRLPRDVAEHDVARRAPRRSRQMHDVGDGR